MQKVTAIITTYNEAHNIQQAIESVLWADEVLVVDSFSTDNTLAIAQKFSEVTCLQHVYESPALQKNWSIQRANNPWVFILDADERVEQPLKEEIQALLKKPMYGAYWVYRKNHFLGKELKHIWKNDKVIRLFRKHDFQYENVQVHEEIAVPPREKIGVLKEKLVHFSYKSMPHFLKKMQRYAQWSAQDHASTQNMGLYHFVLKPFARFGKHYLGQKGFLDGYRGLIVSVIMAWGVFLRYVFLYEQRNGK